jgi:riboflavin synthase
MFTGLVETTGTFAGLARGPAKAARLSLRVPGGFGPVKVGDSVAVNGVCLTTVKTGPGALEMDVLDETLAKTNLGALRAGERVNLERSLTPSSELGGHLVTGHVDATGTVRMRTRQGADWIFEIGVEPGLMPFIAPKGSIAVDGISLTVVDTEGAAPGSPGGADATATGPRVPGGGAFSVHIIPCTFENTTLGERTEGARVNIEVDLIARYVINYLTRAVPELAAGRGGQSKLTKEFLAEHGFA